MTNQSDYLGLAGWLQEDAPGSKGITSASRLDAGAGPLFYHGMSLADLAHVVVLLEAGIIPHLSGTKLLAALLSMHAIPAPDFPFNPVHGDAYANREYYLRQHTPTPSVVGWLKAGRPQQEVSTIAYLIVVRQRLLRLIAGITRLMQTLLDLAQDNLTTVVPDYAYLQLSHPTTLAHYLLSFGQPLTRDLTRLQGAFEHTNRSPAGLGSINGSRLPLNRDRLAKLLAFKGLTLHTQDAMWQADGPIEVMTAVVALLINADRLAENLQSWASAEFEGIEFSEAHLPSEVIRLQKQKPYNLAFVRGVAREMIGRLVSTTAVGAISAGQVDNHIFAYSQVPASLDLATQAINLLASVVANLTLNHNVLARRVAEGYKGINDLSDLIMLEAKLDPETAHYIVEWAMKRALDRKKPLDARLLDAAAVAIVGHPLNLAQERISEALDPLAIVKARTGAGGAAPEAVQSMIDVCQALMTECEMWRVDTKTHLAAAETELLETAKKMTTIY